MEHDPHAALRRALAEKEAWLDRMAQDFAAQFPLPPAVPDDPNLSRAVTLLSDGLQQLTSAANRLRFSRGGAPPGDLHRSLAEVDARARRFASLIASIRRIIMAGPRPLYPEDDLRDLWSEQALASDRVYMALNRVVNPESQNEAAETLGCWPDIPLRNSRFLHHVHAAYRVALAQGRPAPVRFLDVGCGGGMKVLLAAEFFACADGLEYDPGYAATARQVLDRAGRLPSQVVQGDALTFDGYGDYDVIYFYQPMQSPEGLIALEQRIATLARPGTILIAPYGLFSDRAQSLGCGRVDGAVYLAATPDDEAAAVCRRAERFGVEIPRTDDWKSLTPGYVKTLVDACHLAGYEVV